MVTLTKVYPPDGVGAEHFLLSNVIIEARLNLGCINSGSYLLYNGYEGVTGLVRRAQCPIGIAVVDESRRLHTLGQRQVVLLFASL